jgi:hypothetical protein
MVKDLRRSFIHVDLDGSWAMRRHFGRVSDHRGSDVVFEDGLPRLLELLGIHGVSATFFVVGCDLEVPGRRELLRRAVQAGHRVASHTYSHPEGFSGLPPREMRWEITNNTAAIRIHLGVRPVGFRAPNFELTGSTLEMLVEDGYLYDSSVIGTPAAPLLRLYHRFRTRRGGGSAAAGGLYMGAMRTFLAPRGPYPISPSCLWRPGSGPLREFPVATMPLLRLPVHASYLRLYGHRERGRLLFALTLQWYLQRYIPFTFLVHLSDIATQEREDDLRGEVGNALSDEERWELLDFCLTALRHQSTILTTEDFLGR